MSCSDYGTVEGRLDGVILHGGRYFYVRDALTSKQIPCHFITSDISVRSVADALHRRVAVQGHIFYRANGAVDYVCAESLEVFPLEEQLPSADDVCGILNTGHS